MNTPLIVGIAALIVVWAGVGAYAYVQSQSASTEPTEVTTQTSEETAPESEVVQNERLQASFLELIRMGRNYQCTFSTTDDLGTATVGEVYVADQGTRLKGDFTMTEPTGAVTDTHIIRDGQFNYIWSPAMEQGMKFAIDPELESVFGPGQDSEQPGGFDETQPVEFDCQPWTPNAGLFVPPANVEFVDMTAQVQRMGEQLQANPELSCGACDQLPEGEARAQCRLALGC